MRALVASLAEAWIEIKRLSMDRFSLSVASLAEAWIEIYDCRHYGERYESPPSRRRGLKYDGYLKFENYRRSPPSRRRGLKSEGVDKKLVVNCRLPRGGVD